MLLSVSKDAVLVTIRPRAIFFNALCFLAKWFLTNKILEKKNKWVCFVYILDTCLSFYEKKFTVSCFSWKIKQTIFLTMLIILLTSANNFVSTVVYNSIIINTRVYYKKFFVYFFYLKGDIWPSCTHSCEPKCEHLKWFVYTCTKTLPKTAVKRKKAMNMRFYMLFCI